MVLSKASHENRQGSRTQNAEAEDVLAAAADVIAPTQAVVDDTAASPSALALTNRVVIHKSVGGGESSRGKIGVKRIIEGREGDGEEVCGVRSNAAFGVW
mmetsp:Transcript_28121/g.51919  ORF Transcript_28121/g.51919 Transcript_28121/m.51919 type:complete len:100 (-) Transcript_28121:42-341(-)|eukprot:CAMPEP_0201975992 /NCGR_PEP_ID=MMETSP0904-20121228/55688_1 /ASSEMBLY_ACC=CAM_ASM_000553 /TAXON_ID=420261 /ORGANISM="Thalassiosira antarctica, Strain CCMP982" /LENGTH=99 /DNA_ID=CAMNT_0048526937 /DNA_START=56 /DNA_END=355 /DNA_ORIENTATION=+